MKQRLRNWLHDLLWAPGQQERQGVIALAIICVLSVLIPNILQYRKDLADQRWLLALSSQQRNWMDSLKRIHPSETDRLAFLDSLGSFDPNKVDSAFWMSLGLGMDLSRRIINYQRAGGYFAQPSDLKKIYGFSPSRYEEIAPFIQIEQATAKPKFSKASSGRRSKVSDDLPHSTMEAVEPQKPRQPSSLKVDINLASPDELIRLRGIGPTLSGRAVKFREQLGGFYSVEQFGELYGLSDSVFQLIQNQLKCTGELRRLDINHADSIALSSHPYLAPWLAGQILERRRRLGFFLVPEDLLELKSMNRELLDKLLPYLLFEG
jgi:DNA uptake protein ComE-like DNA-binding protein